MPVIRGGQSASWLEDREREAARAARERQTVRANITAYPSGDLPKGSRLRRKWDAFQEVAEESQQLAAHVGDLQGQLEEVQFFLDSATLATTTPAIYAEQLALKVLLERDLAPALRKHESAQAGVKAKSEQFYDAYRQYCADVELLQRGQVETDRPLTATEREEIAARGSEAIEA